MWNIYMSRDFGNGQADHVQQMVQDQTQEYDMNNVCETCCVIIYYKYIFLYI